MNGMSEVCWHCLRCHWYCDDVLEECRGQSEPCHEFKLCREDIEKMQNKFEDGLVNVNDVIEAVDKHTREDETLDEDISVILEEVKTAFDKEKVIENTGRMPAKIYEIYKALSHVASLHGLEIIGLRDKYSGKEWRK